MVAASQTADLLVVGAGVVGLCAAREWKARHRGDKVVVLEKEPDVARHASGRNSGVLHAGFYYSADSLKARFSRRGCAAWTAYCQERDLPLNPCGKLVVARDESEHAALDELLRRAEANGVDLRPISEAEAREIEPAVRTAGRALWSPTTATVDPEQVMARLAAELEDQGVEIRLGQAYLGREGRRIRTPAETLEPGFLLNAAGLYADRIAADFGFGAGVQILPFQGHYLYSSWEPGRLRTNVYPVPDLANPFLGVHFTLTATGRAKIGPTATPAFWREHYQGLGGFSLRELAEIVPAQLGLLWKDEFGFRGLAWRELAKLRRRDLVRRAGELLEGMEAQEWTRWGRPGVRAQLLDLRTRRLVQDFLLEGDDQSLHVLNAISPAFTCALPFAEALCDRIEGRSPGAS